MIKRLRDIRIDCSFMFSGVAIVLVIIVSGCTSLRIESVPSGASIILNNRPTGKMTPANFSAKELSRGKYDVSLQKDGYQILNDPAKFIISTTRNARILATIILPPFALNELCNDGWKDTCININGVGPVEVWVGGKRMVGYENMVRSCATANKAHYFLATQLHAIIKYQLIPLPSTIGDQVKNGNISGERDAKLSNSNENTVMSRSSETFKGKTGPLNRKPTLTSETLSPSKVKYDDVVTRLRQLRELRDSGELTQQEYDTQRKALIDAQ